MESARRKNRFFRGIALLIGFGTSILIIAVICKEYQSWINRSETFHVRKIEVQGNDLLSDEDILRLGGFDSKGSIWDIDLNEAKKKIGYNALVEGIEIERIIPDEIQIRIKEKSPIALLNVEGNMYCIDRKGLVLPSKPGKLYDLPILSGDFRGGVSVGSVAENDFVSIGLNFLMSVMMERPKLYSVISEIKVGNPEGIILYTCEGGVPVRVGADNHQKKIRCLEAILDELAEKKGFSRIQYIDLQFEDQVVVGMRK